MGSGYAGLACSKALGSSAARVQAGQAASQEVTKSQGLTLAPVASFLGLLGMCCSAEGHYRARAQHVTSARPVPARRGNHMQGLSFLTLAIG